MKKKMIAVAAMMLIVLSSVFIACGSANSSYYKEDSGAGYDEVMPAETGAEAAYREDAKAAEAAARIDGEISNEERVQQQVSNQKLVYTCYLRMETTTYADTLADVRGLITKYDAFVESEDQSDSASTWYYSDYRKTGGTLTDHLVIRVPAQNYDAFLNDLDGKGKILEKNTSVENITLSYSDTETMIEALKTQEERLLEMLEQCETIEDMITVEARLTEVQSQLKVYESRLAGMDLDIAYSTVDLSIREVLEYSADPDPKYTSTFGDRLRNTLKESWETAKAFMEGLLFFLIRALPILVILGVFGGVIALIVILIVKGAKKKNAKKRTKAAQQQAQVQPQQTAQAPQQAAQVPQQPEQPKE